MIGLRLIGAVTGFFIGSLTLLALYFIAQFTMSIFDLDHMRFRAPVILFILPFILAFWGFKLAPEISLVAKAQYQSANTPMRLVFITPFFWTAVVLAYIFVFEPFGYRIYDSDWLYTGKIIIFPSAVLWTGTLIYVKFAARQ